MLLARGSPELSSAEPPALAVPVPGREPRCGVTDSARRNSHGSRNKTRKSWKGEVARLYERVITEFPNVLNNDTRTERPQLMLGRPAMLLPAVAEAHLDELRRLSVGKPCSRNPGRRPGR